MGITASINHHHPTSLDFYINHQIQREQDHPSGFLDFVMAQAKSTGTCKWFNSEKGYGFITCDNGSEDVFVHQTSIHANGFRNLEEGEKLEFDIVEVMAEDADTAVEVTADTEEEETVDTEEMAEDTEEEVAEDTRLDQEPVTTVTVRVTLHGNAHKDSRVEVDNSVEAEVITDTVIITEVTERERREKK